jgi:hypothetical protein
MDKFAVQNIKNKMYKALNKYCKFGEDYITRPEIVDF